MQVGEVLFILLFNCLIIGALYIWQKKTLEKKIKQLNKEVQDLEDLVAAIIEEFEEIAEMTESKVFPNQSAFLEAPLSEESTPVAEVEKPPEPLTVKDNEMEELKQELDNHKSFFVASEILEHTTNHQFQSTNTPIKNLENQRPVNDPKHQKILELWEAGYTIEEIAKQFGTGRGEIQLVLGIYRRS